MDHTGDLPGFVRDMLQLSYVLMTCQLAHSDRSRVNWIPAMKFIRLPITENEHIDIFLYNKIYCVNFEENLMDSFLCIYVEYHEEDGVQGRGSEWRNCTGTWCLCAAEKSDELSSHIS